MWGGKALLLEGGAHKFGDEVNTDIHVSAKYRPPDMSMKQLVHCMLNELDEGFVKRRRPGDFIVAGKHFGTVSSREDAVEVIKAAGISAVVVQSFGHMFYRNAINLGLLVIEADTAGIETGDILTIDKTLGVIRNISKGYEVAFNPLPKIILEIISHGGLLSYIKAKGDLSG